MTAVGVDQQSVSHSEVFWEVEYLKPSAWLSHVPFAFALIAALRPRKVVELGTHTGVSYFAFCQAVERLGVNTACFAVDTWEGDDFTGPYGSAVFDEVRAYNERKYATSSSLVREDFTAAARLFGHGEIDLLHIDGSHAYEDVADDFRTWEPLLSDRAIVLIHDINERRSGFGVQRFWSEISSLHTSVEFSHGHGLGVLVHGRDCPGSALKLLAAVADDAGPMRRLFASRGEAVRRMLLLDEARSEAAAGRAKIAELTSKVDDLDEKLAISQGESMALREARDAALSEALNFRSLYTSHVEAQRQAMSHIGVAYSQFRGTTRQSGRPARHVEQLQQQVADVQVAADAISADLAIVYASRSWRFTAPLRNLFRRFRRLVGEDG